MSKIFEAAVYKVTVRAGEQGLLLPPYKGSTLRGGFGSVFRRISCSMRGSDCRPCLLRTSCPYAYIFETAPLPGSEALRNYENIPRPFIIEPPLDTRTSYKSGEKLCFNLILIGRAINYLPYFIVAFRELGETGIGRARKKYRLDEIKAVDPSGSKIEIVYSAGDRLVKNTDLAWRCDIARILDEQPPGGVYRQKTETLSPSAGATCDTQGARRATLHFRTMTRIKFTESYTSRIEFHMLIRNLLRRLSSLAYFHHGWELDLDFTGLIERAAGVRLVEDNTRWVNWERYSSRQDSKMNLGGVVGTVVYEGDLDEFIPLLRLGELVHVGKGAVFGMGKYEMEK